MLGMLFVSRLNEQKAEPADRCSRAQRSVHCACRELAVSMTRTLDPPAAKGAQPGAPCAGDQGVWSLQVPRPRGFTPRQCTQAHAGARTLLTPTPLPASPSTSYSSSN